MGVSSSPRARERAVKLLPARGRRGGKEGGPHAKKCAPRAETLKIYRLLVRCYVSGIALVLFV